MAGYHIDINKTPSSYVVSEHGVFSPEEYTFHDHAGALSHAKRLANNLGLWVHDFSNPKPDGTPTYH